MPNHERARNNPNAVEIEVDEPIQAGEVDDGYGDPVEVNESTIVRTVGIEIECIVPEEGYYSLRSERPTNKLDVAMQALGQEVRNDGSIEGEGIGREIVTKPLKGEAAEEMVYAISKVLKEVNAYTNTSTGLHVHVDAKEVAIQSFVREVYNVSELRDGEQMVYMHSQTINDVMRNARGVRDMERGHLYEIANAYETMQKLKAVGPYGEGYVLESYSARRLERSLVDGRYVIPESRQSEYQAYAVNSLGVSHIKHKLFMAMRFFGAIDPVLRGLVPSSRRHNTYCQPFEKIARNGGNCPETLMELVSGITQRYCGINLRALEKHGTIEVRYHGGTINADKIIHWARLFERIVDVALSNEAEREADALSEVVNPKNKLEMLLALLNVPESTQKYLKERHTAFFGSDARHAISYINKKTQQHARRANMNALRTSVQLDVSRRWTAAPRAENSPAPRNEYGNTTSGESRTMEYIISREDMLQGRYGVDITGSNSTN